MSIMSRLLGSKTPVEPAALPYEERSPEGLAARWVRWAASFGPVSNPVDDDTGDVAGERQPEDVWFLAGTFGNRTITRRCAVPAGRPLFFPVINSWEYGDDLTGAVPVLPGATVECTLAGDPVRLVEIATPRPFEVAGPLGNPVTGRRKPLPVVVWGLWGRVEEPPLGRYDLRLRADDGERFRFDVRYDMTVG